MASMNDKEWQDWTDKFLALGKSSDIQRMTGKAVMWVHALKRLELKQGVTVNMEVLAHAFPMGFPTDAALHKLWDEQKGLGEAKDNYLDTVAP